MIKLFILFTLMLTACAGDEGDNNTGEDIQPSCTSDYQVKHDRWGNGWFMYRSQGHECAGKLNDGYARCYRFNR